MNPYKDKFNQLELRVLDLINTTIDGEYLGNLKVVVEDDYYILLLHLNRDYVPLRMGHPGPEEDFLAFLKSEFKNRKLERIRRWEGLQIKTDDPNDGLDDEDCDEEWEDGTYPVIAY